MPIKEKLSAAFGHHIPVIVAVGLTIAGGAAFIVGKNAATPEPMPTPDCPKDMAHTDEGGPSTALLKCPEPR